MRKELSFGARAVIVLALGALAAPGLGHARIDPECGRGGKPISAEITQPGGGQLTVVTAATGPVAVDALGDGVVISTTGIVPVSVDYSCIMNLTLTVRKEGPGDPELIDTHTWEDVDLNTDDPVLPCAQSAVTHDVEIGLDGGQYSFTLSGTGCNGLPLVPVSSGRVVGDPPLGI